MRDLYHHLGEPKTWQTLIVDPRELNRRLPALQDELNKAGLQARSNLRRRKSR